MSIGNVNGGNNTGWVFVNPTTVSAGQTLGFAPFAAGSFADTAAVPANANYTITALNGTYSLTGQTATVTYTAANNYAITALSGSYALSGQNAGIVYSGTPFIVIDTHDGDYHKKKFDDAKAKAKRKKADIIQAYERLVEGKPDVAEEIAAPYIKPPNDKHLEPFINYDKLLADVDRANRLWQAYIDMDDEEVLMLL